MVAVATPTQLTFDVPVGATYQPITVNVGGLIAYSAMPFTVTFAGGGTIDACSFAARVDVSGNNSNSGSIGDLDGDGKVDIAVTTGALSRVSVFLNTSSGAGNISYAFFANFTTGGNPPNTITCRCFYSGQLRALCSGSFLPRSLSGHSIVLSCTNRLAHSAIHSRRMR